MKKIFVTLLVVFVAMIVKADAFTGLNEAKEEIRYCGTAKVISVDVCDCSTVVKFANKYRSLDNDTIVERIYNGIDFIAYLSIGDEIDFCIDECEDYFIMKRLRLKGSEECQFLDDIKNKGISTILRIHDDGVILLANGLIIKNPKQQHKVGDTVAYRLRRQLMFAEEISKRVL